MDDRLRPWLEHPGSAAVLTDFDGTLAPIVDDPAAAVALPGAAEVLAALSARYGRVGVVSGRPVSYLLDRLGAVAGGLVLAGLYGLERVDAGVIVTHPDADRWRPAVEDVAGAARRDAPRGVIVESKALTVTLHARTAPGALTWIEAFAAAQAGATGLVAHAGRLSVELRPPIRADKGTVVADLAAGMTAVCFAGDDRGDLPAFAALQSLRSAGVSTLAVAAASGESPPELLAAADLVVDGPEGVLALLRRLAGDVAG